MSTYSSSENQLEKIDITRFVDEFLNAFRKMWIIVLVLTAGLGALGYLRIKDSYIPSYTAEATVAVTVKSDGKMNDSKTAEQLGVIFPYILTSGVLKDVIIEDMGVTSLPGTIKVTNIEGTNLLTISVTTSDQMNSYNELMSVIRNYPKVAQYVVGETELDIIDESGIPEDTGKAISYQSNVIKYASIGLLIGLLMVFIRMVLFRTVRNSKDLKSISNLNYLGTLPVYKLKKRRQGKNKISIMEHNVQQDYLEAIRLIRARVTQRLTETGNKVVMVTSSIPGEGKSTVAANLAMSISRKDRNVVLIDCDLRNPSLQEIFDVDDDQPGIIDVLTGDVNPADALVSYEDKGLRLLVLFGNRDKVTEHAEILSGKSMGQLLKALREVADIIILDTPPSAMLVDAMMVAKYVDEAVYVIKCDYARRHVIINGIQELKDAGVEIGGVILNGGKEGSAGYGYHTYGYGYGSHYYYGDSKSKKKKLKQEVEDTMQLENLQETEESGSIPVQDDIEESGEIPAQDDSDESGQIPVQEETSHEEGEQ
ncbi:MAG: polysaccharide biosynthesis tyrosine autokinase [Solobacterium sp.]|nr:polysaccharide biosynthesis tyrosine autokinase [Solobacterium sp.]